MAKKTVHRINEHLANLAWPLGKLKEDPKNARNHDDRNITAIAASLARFGQQKPIVVSPDGVVLAGNGMFRAAKALGWTHLAAVVFDKKEEAEKVGYAIADNRTAELADWDDVALAQALTLLNEANDGELVDVGFNDEEFMEILARVEQQEAEVPEIEEQESQATPGAPASEQGGGVEASPEAPAADVRYVQLFFDSETHETFVERVKYLATLYGTTNITDTVHEAVRRQYEAAKQEG